MVRKNSGGKPDGWVPKPSSIAEIAGRRQEGALSNNGAAHSQRIRNVNAQSRRAGKAQVRISALYDAKLDYTTKIVNLTDENEGRTRRLNHGLVYAGGETNISLG